MSHNMSLAVLRDTTLDEIGVGDPTPVPFDLAVGFDDMRLFGAQVGGHVVVADALLGTRATALGLALGRQVYVVALSGVASTYVLEAHGPRTRLLVHTNGEVVEDRGAPLPAESVLSTTDDLEDAHLELVVALVDADHADLWEASFVVLAPADDLA